MQYSIIPSDSHATQAFTWLEQGPDELLDEYIHCAHKLLSKIYHTLDMSSISVEGLTHYAVVYGLNCNKLKDTITGHWNVQWKMMEECFRDICNISVGYEWAKDYFRAELNTPDASCIAENFTIGTTIICCQQEPFHSRHLNQLSQVKICQ